MDPNDQNQQQMQNDNQNQPLSDNQNQAPAWQPSQQVQEEPVSQPTELKPEENQPVQDVSGGQPAIQQPPAPEVPQTPEEQVNPVEPSSQFGVGETTQPTNEPTSGLTGQGQGNGDQPQGM